MTVTLHQDSPPGADSETVAGRERRIREEAAAIAAAERELAAGQGLDEATLAGWLESLDADPDLPLPKSPAPLR